MSQYTYTSPVHTRILVPNCVPVEKCISTGTEYMRKCSTLQVWSLIGHVSLAQVHLRLSCANGRSVPYTDYSPTRTGLGLASHASQFPPATGDRWLWERQSEWLHLAAVAEIRQDKTYKISQFQIQCLYNIW